MIHNKHNQFMKTYKMALHFNLNNSDYPPLPNSIVFLFLPFCLHLLLHQGRLRLKFVLFTKFFPNATNKPLTRATRFFPGNFSPKHLHNSLLSLAFDLTCKVLTRLKHHFICKSEASFESVGVNVNFGPVPLC